MNRPQVMQYVRVCECGCGQPTMVRNHNASGAGRIKGQPARFAHGGGTRVRHSVRPDMWVVDEASGCWVGVNSPNADGYTDTKVGPRRARTHILVWEHFNGPVPDGLQLDHLCRNRACCNPEHLEPVTQTVNVRRGARAKLTESAATAIRASSEHYSVLAARYGVSKATIHAVRAGTAWVIQASRERETAAVS